MIGQSTEGLNKKELRVHAAEIRQQIEATQEKNVKLKKTIGEQEKEIESLRGMLVNTERSLSTTLSGSNAAKSELRDLQEENLMLKSEIGEVNDSLATLEVELFVYKSMSQILIAESNQKKLVETEKETPKKESETKLKVPLIPEIEIGGQVWMVSNLNVDKFRNGDPIPQVKGKEAWEQAGNDRQPAWCYANNDPKTGSKYGKLYNWYAVNDSRGLAPEGWHVPSQDEWTRLVNYLGGESLAFEKLQTTKGWRINGTNESGFSALPNGTRGVYGPFESIDNYASWWTSSTVDYDRKAARCISFQHYYGARIIDIDDGYKPLGLAVRCIKSK